ncbi:MAG: hypothetical protein J7K96_13825, partial [Desulfobacteraceae bacterium]|nr:hypothetical protein [Desulfobacteraceae bacterium]
QYIESTASIKEPSIDTSSPSPAYFLGKILPASVLRFWNTYSNCSRPLELMASKKLLFPIPSLGAMFSRAKSSSFRT